MVYSAETPSTNQNCDSFFGSRQAPDLKNVLLARQKNAELGTISNATEVPYRERNVVINQQFAMAGDLSRVELH